MRLTVFLVIATCLQVCARTGYSQTVSFTGKDVPIPTVFSAIEKQTGLSFFFNNALVKDARPVTLDLHEVTVEVALHETLKNAGLDFYQHGKTIFIVKRGGDVALDGSGAPVPTGGTIRAHGTVLNETGQPLAGANVTIKGSGRGTVTDAKGEFELSGVPVGSVLMISYIGYSTQQLKFDDEGAKKIYLAVAKNELDRVTIQAYGTTSQRFTTGSIGVIRSEDIAKQPVMNPLEVIQGQIPGVVVTNTTGYASGVVKVEVRGRSTINPNFPSDPLYIVDGVPLTILDISNTSNYANGFAGITQSGFQGPAGGQSPLLSLNPSDIESIEVLKDADATAIYGSRGSNGVILITTKKGKAGKTHFDVSGYEGEGSILKYYPLMNTTQYLSMRREALNNDQLPIDVNNAADLTVWDTTGYTNWEKYLSGGIARETDAEGYVNGGDQATTFRLGGGYHYQRDLTALSGGNKRIAASVSLNHRSLNQRLSIAFVGNYTYGNSNIINQPPENLIPPNAPPVFDKLGNLNYAGWAPLDLFYPFGYIFQPYFTTTNFLNTNLNVNFELAKGLTLRGNFGYNNITNNQRQLITLASQNPNNSPSASLYTGYSFIRNLIFEPQLEYTRFLWRGKLDILAGASTQNNLTSSVFASGSGYANDALLSSVTNGTIKYTTYSEGDYRYAALFGRVNYNLQDKYILQLNARRDGSSKFGPGREYGNFGSIAGAWIFSEEAWIKKTFGALSFGKLRGSYGLVGGDQINSYSYLTQWQFGQFTYNNSLPLNPIKHTDSLLHWQVNHKTEVTLNLGFLHDRILLDATWYRNVCGDQLLPIPTPYFTGFSSVISNSPAKVENYGYEFVATVKIVETNRIKLQMKANIGINRNRLLAYPNLAQSPYSNTFVVGKSLNIVKLLHYTGVDPMTGLYTFQDLNHDGNVTIDYSGKTSDDRYALDASPKYDGGITAALSYKSLSLSALMYFRRQLGYNAYAGLDFAGDLSNQPTEVIKNHWQKPGDIAQFARYTTAPYDNSFQNFRTSDAQFTDASFARLQNVVLSYALDPKVLRKAKMDQCTVYIRCENLFLITKYKGPDPETQNFGGLPIPKTITAGISCGF